MLACWDSSGEDHQFGFLSMKPIPESATFTVESLENYVFGSVDVAKMGGTHFMSVRCTKVFLECCDVPSKQRWPEHHFYLRREHGVFRLVHYCPMQDQVDGKPIARLWPMTSGRRAMDAVARMSAVELDAFRQQPKRDAFPLRALYAIQERCSVGPASRAGLNFPRDDATATDCQRADRQRQRAMRSLESR
jgi:hypothetical protein